MNFTKTYVWVKIHPLREVSEKKSVFAYSLSWKNRKSSRTTNVHKTFFTVATKELCLKTTSETLETNVWLERYNSKTKISKMSRFHPQSSDPWVPGIHGSGMNHIWIESWRHKLSIEKDRLEKAFLISASQPFENCANKSTYLFARVHLEWKKHFLAHFPKSITLGQDEIFRNPRRW